MPIDEVTVSRKIIERFAREFLRNLDVDVVIAGAGPASLTAARYLAKGGLRTVIFERKLTPGGGMWGGGLTFPVIVVQEGSRHLLKEIGVRLEDSKDGYFTADSVEASAKLIASAIDAGARLFNTITVEDVVIRADRICGVVINSSAQNQLALRRGIGATLIPNVMNFEKPPAPPDAYAADVRSALGVAEDELFVLQPTRVVQRKGIEHAIELVARLGRKAVLAQADVRDPEQVKALFARAKDELGGVDILVNNAGINRPAAARSSNRRCSRTWRSLRSTCSASAPRAAIRAWPRPRSARKPSCCWPDCSAARPSLWKA